MMREIPLSGVRLAVNEPSFSRVKRFINSGSDRRLLVAHTELLQGWYRNQNKLLLARLGRCLQMGERASSPQINLEYHLSIVTAEALLNRDISKNLDARAGYPATPPYPEISEEATTSSPFPPPPQITSFDLSPPPFVPIPQIFYHPPLAPESPTRSGSFRAIAEVAGRFYFKRTYHPLRASPHGLRN